MTGDVDLHLCIVSLSDIVAACVCKLNLQYMHVCGAVGVGYLRPHPSWPATLPTSSGQLCTVWCLYCLSNSKVSKGLFSDRPALNPSLATHACPSQLRGSRVFLEPPGHKALVYRGQQCRGSKSLSKIMSPSPPSLMAGRGTTSCFLFSPLSCGVLRFESACACPHAARRPCTRTAERKVVISGVQSD